MAPGGQGSRGVPLLAPWQQQDQHGNAAANAWRPWRLQGSVSPGAQQCSSMLQCKQAPHTPAALPTAPVAAMGASLSRARGTAALQQDRL